MATIRFIDAGAWMGMGNVPDRGGVILTDESGFVSNCDVSMHQIY